MPEPHYAHTPPEGDPGRWHLLSDHLNAVAELAGGFGAAFGGEEVCRALGLAHDLGKADPRFQAYLRACARGGSGPSAVQHAAPGAAAVFDALGTFAMVVLGHHAGLHDRAVAYERIRSADPEATAAAAALGAAIGRPAAPAWLRTHTATELFIRICFSALTDADYLDTEAHMSPATSAERSAGRAIEWYAATLDAHLAGLAAGAPDSKVNRVRAESLAACLAAAPGAPGAYRLTVPTGGGKTLSGLAFALHHAQAHGLRRVVMAIPYTSIIDQTAQVYSGIFGRDQVLEHHSAYDPEAGGEGQGASELRRKLAAENWDSPLVVTTTVQLFDSLFSNRSRACRKLHRLAGSVIVLDEAQTLPPELLAPILDVLQELVAHYRCTVVFCTATQPDYSPLQGSLIVGAREIVPEPRRLFDALRRVRFRREEAPLTLEELAARVDASGQALCILNRRKDAVRTVRACRPGADLFHLSTLMCPMHRRRVLDEVRGRLERGEPVRLVATQVVEAGVDLDFPLVLRATGPLDRIVQAAGRCNREGRREGLGDCVIFDLADAGAPRGWYRTGIALAATMLREDAESIDQPDRVAEYFRDLYAKTDTDARRIGPLRAALCFDQVAEKFQMIEPGSTLLLRAYGGFDVGALLAVPEAARGADWRRRAAQGSVSVPHYEARKMEADGLISTEEGGMKVYEGVYDDLVGIGMGYETDPADLVV